MPRNVVVLFAFLIVGAAIAGAWRGYQFTNLDQTPPAVEPSVRIAAAGPGGSAPLGLDEAVVREMARLEVRQLIRAAPAPAKPAAEPVAAPLVLAATTPLAIETPTVELAAPEGLQLVSGGG